MENRYAEPTIYEQAVISHSIKEKKELAVKDTKIKLLKSDKLKHEQIKYRKTRRTLQSNDFNIALALGIL